MAGNIINRLSYYVIKLHQYSHIEIYGMKVSWIFLREDNIIF